MLMIIDFVFGGESYIAKNKDVIANIGDHEFDFIFTFKETNYYFKRATNNYRTVTICNEDFIPQRGITVSEYCTFLKEMYSCQLEDMTFREIVGRYFRIYGKENLNEKKPLQFFDKETSKNSILNLMKLFNQYKNIKYLSDIVINAKEDKEILESAMRKNLVPNVESKIYATNNISISRLQSRLDALKDEAVKTSLNSEAMISNEVIELKERKSELVIRLNVLRGRLR